MHLLTTDLLRPITTVPPANKYVGIEQSITYGKSNTTILPMAAGIVDTGVIQLLLSTGETVRSIGVLVLG